MTNGNSFSSHLHDGAHGQGRSELRNEAVERQMKIAKMIGNDQFKIKSYPNVGAALQMLNVA